MYLKTEHMFTTIYISVYAVNMSVGSNELSARLRHPTPSNARSGEAPRPLYFETEAHADPYALYARLRETPGLVRDAR